MKKAEAIQLADLQLNSGAAFEALYLRHRDEFISFGRRYLQSDEDIIDSYQDAIIALFERVQSGKLVSLTSSTKTYLFSIGKYLMIDKHKANRKMRTESEDKLGLIEVRPEPEPQLSESAEQLYNALSKMGDSCRRILTLFYYRSYDLESIAHALNYKNSNVVKSHKARCMQRLREIYHQMS